MIQNLLLLFNAIVAVLLVLIILLQRQDTSGGGILGGANAGAAPVVRNGLAKPTTILAILFMGSSLFLAILSSGQGGSTSVLDGTEQPAGESALPTQTAPLPMESQIPPIPLPTSEDTQ